MDLKPVKIVASLENRSPFFWIVVGTVLISLLGTADSLTGNEITFSLFYILPIVLVTWFVNQRMGLVMSFLSALTLLIAEIAAGQTYSHPIVYFLNTLIRAVFYVIITY